MASTTGESGEALEAATRPTLLLLHGVGSGDSGEWKSVISRALVDIGYPDLEDVRVVAPLYAHALKGSDDDDRLPPITIKAPTREVAKKIRREFERKAGALEIRLAGHDQGSGWVGGKAIGDLGLALPKFSQAKKYLTDSRIRAQVLKRILLRVPQTGPLVIVGHSLGSVIAADLVRRLPPALPVTGLITIGSPLAHPEFDGDRLRENLKEPPPNLSWWVNFWSITDPVTTHQGVSSVFPWVVDYRVSTVVGLSAHDAEHYLANRSVAEAIGMALFGSQSKELAVLQGGVDIPLDYAETIALAALRYGHLCLARLTGELRDRYAEALRQTQAAAIESIVRRNQEAGRPLPGDIARLSFDRADPDAPLPEPRPISHLSKDEAIVPLLSIAAANIIRPFEITVPMQVRRDAMEDLTAEMWLGGQIGTDVLAATEDARKALGAGAVNWIKWVALGVGAIALVAATGGLALAAAPGVVGAAAITSALAAFGPGGMIGGLLTAGTLVTAGGGGIAIGLASPTTSAEAVEAMVGAQLAAALLRDRQGLEQDTTTWATLVETGIALRRELARLGAVSDDSAASLKELKRKLVAIDRALTYLSKRGLGPTDFEGTAES